MVQGIDIIENVQRGATKPVPEIKALTYEEWLRKLDLPTLAYRRSRGNVIETFKILCGKGDEDCTEGLFTMQVTQEEILERYSRIMRN